MPADKKKGQSKSRNPSVVLSGLKIVSGREEMGSDIREAPNPLRCSPPWLVDVNKTISMAAQRTPGCSTDNTPPPALSLTTRLHRVRRCYIGKCVA